MRRIEITATIADDGTLTAQAPPNIPPGTHKVVILVDDAARADAHLALDLPEFHLGSWPEDLSLRREDMYGDWGR